MKQKEELAMLQLLTKAQKICGTQHVQRLRVKTSFDSSLFVVNHVSLEWILIFKSMFMNDGPQM